jgi:hypothetical protein
VNCRFPKDTGRNSDGAYTVRLRRAAILLRRATMMNTSTKKMIPNIIRIVIGSITANSIGIVFGLIKVFSS